MACQCEHLMDRLESLNKSHRVCNDHFDSKVFSNEDRSRLIANAVPTIFPTLEGSSLKDHTYNRPPRQVHCNPLQEQLDPDNPYEVCPPKKQIRVLQDIVIHTPGISRISIIF